MTYPIIFKAKKTPITLGASLLAFPVVGCTATPGASCRLYPAAEADTAAGEEAETAEPETAENADESEGEEIQELLKSEGLGKIHGTFLMFFFVLLHMVKYHNLTMTSCEILQLYAFVC